MSQVQNISNGNCHSNGSCHNIVCFSFARVFLYEGLLKVEFKQVELMLEELLQHIDKQSINYIPLVEP